MREVLQNILMFLGFAFCSQNSSVIPLCLDLYIYGAMYLHLEENAQSSLIQQTLATWCSPISRCFPPCKATVPVSVSRA